MNRVTPEAYIPYIHQAQQERTKSPSVEIGNARITRGDIIDITNKKGDMVRYTVTDIKIGDGSPDRLLLQSLDSNRRTFKDIKTLAKSPDMFHVLTQKERERAAEAEITALQNKAALRQTAEGLTDEVIDRAFDDMRKKPDKTTSVETAQTPLSVVEAEINRATPVFPGEKRASTPIETVQAELDTFVSLRNQLRAKEESHIEEMRRKIANMMDENASNLTSQGAVEMTAAERDRFFSAQEQTPAPGFSVPTREKIEDTIQGARTRYEEDPDGLFRERVAANRAAMGIKTITNPTEFSSKLAADRAARDAQQTQTTPSFFGRLASGLRNLFGKKPELRTGANVLPRTVYTPDEIPELPNDAHLPTEDTTADSGSYRKAA